MSAASSQAAIAYPPLPKGRAPLRFGLMIDGPELDAWQEACLSHLLDSGYAELALVIRDATPPPAGRSKWQLIKRGGLLFRIYRRKWVGRRASATRPVSIASYIADIPQMNCETERSGWYVQRFSKADVARINDADLDFILRFGFNIIKGDILNAARYGVWSYHHDDERVIRGGPPAFWEVYHAMPLSGVILQRLTESLDGGVVLHRGQFPTIMHSFSANLNQSFWGATEWVTRVCAEIVMQGDARVCALEAAPVANHAPLYRVPGDRLFVRFLLRQFLRLIGRIVRRGFLHEIWNVGIVSQSFDSLLESGLTAEPQWAKAPSSANDYIADPFVLDVQGDRVRLLVEDFAYTRGGTISEVCFPESLERYQSTPAIARPYHQSYPFLCNTDDGLLCIPEHGEFNGVAVHRQSTTGWELQAEWLRGQRVVDPTLLQHDGRWWLFYSRGEKGPNNHLYACYADQLDGAWVAHPLNPLVSNVSGSRMGGAFIRHAGGLYRIAQDSTRTYGQAVRIMRVRHLTTTAYEEEEVAYVAPDKHSFWPDGLHTLNIIDASRMVIDGKRLIWHPLAWWYKARLRATLKRQRNAD